MIVNSLWSWWLFPSAVTADTSKASGDGRRGKRGRRWTMRGRGTCWLVMQTPPLWPSLTSGSTWSAGRKFYTGRKNPSWKRVFFVFIFYLTCFVLSGLCSYEVQLESKVRRKGLGKFLIQILQLIANKWAVQLCVYMLKCNHRFKMVWTNTKWCRTVCGGLFLPKLARKKEKTNAQTNEEINKYRNE